MGIIWSRNPDGSRRIDDVEPYLRIKRQIERLFPDARLLDWTPEGWVRLDQEGWFAPQTVKVQGEEGGQATSEGRGGMPHAS